MTYQHIKISAIPAPLGEVIDSSSATSKAITKEMALVHAAPDLLAALEDVMVYMEHNNIAQFADRQGSIEQIAYRNARAAIAKAKGQ